MLSTLVPCFPGVDLMTDFRVYMYIQDRRLMTDATGQQEMLTSPRHPTTSLVFPRVYVCSDLNFVLFVGIWDWTLNIMYGTLSSFSWILSSKYWQIPMNLPYSLQVISMKVLRFCTENIRTFSTLSWLFIIPFKTFSTLRWPKLRTFPTLYLRYLRTFPTLYWWYLFYSILVIQCSQESSLLCTYLKQRNLLYSYNRI